MKSPSSYFPSIQEEYGKPIEHWLKLLKGMKGVKHMDMVAALKAEHGRARPRQRPRGTFQGGEQQSLIRIQAEGGERGHNGETLQGALMSLVDIPSLAAEDQTMDPAVKDYLDSRLESSEARNAASIAEFKTFVTATLVRLEERDAARQRADETQRKEIQTQLDEFRKESKTTRKAIIATGLTILFGTAAINAAIIQSFHNAFDVGLRYSNLQDEMAAQAQKTGAVLMQMDTRLVAIEKSPAEKKR